MSLQETTPSMETGDLCADTAPTPKSKACHDPGAVNDTCGVTTYQDTPYSNYMSYTGTVRGVSRHSGGSSPPTPPPTHTQYYAPLCSLYTSINNILSLTRTIVSHLWGNPFQPLLVDFHI